MKETWWVSDIKWHTGLTKYQVNKLYEKGMLPAPYATVPDRRWHSHVIKQWWEENENSVRAYLGK